ncbi:hypothetical protein ACFW5S_13440 [Streptomyces olivaceus]|uniref:hypothetical protein n=1 Tax=Streptomyces olivaceus TaxID=47716 RepID=UPI0033BC9BD2
MELPIASNDIAAATISAAKAKELHDQVAEAVDRGAVPLHRGSAAGARFLPGQDTSAYAQPAMP